MARQMNNNRLHISNDLCEDIETVGKQMYLTWAVDLGINVIKGNDRITNTDLESFNVDHILTIKALSTCSTARRGLELEILRFPRFTRAPTFFSISKAGGKVSNNTRMILDSVCKW